MGRQGAEQKDSASQVEVLRSFLDAEAQANSTFFQRAPSNPRVPGVQHTAARLEVELKGLSTLPVEQSARDRLFPSGLVYTTVDALVRLVVKLVPSEDPPAAVAGDGDPHLAKTGASASATSILADLALLCLANLLESPLWRHVFFRVLHEVQLQLGPPQERRESPIASSGGGGCQVEPVGVRLQKQRSSTTSLQERLWRKIVTDAPVVAGQENDAAVAAVGATEEVLAISSAPGTLVMPVNRTAVRLCCNMIRHCPFFFSASSYSSLAPHLVDYLGGRGGFSGRDGSCAATGTFVDEPSEGDLMALLDLFAACVRGSPHFRQCVKGLRRKRELFRRLLAFLGPHPRHDDRILVRALSGLTRVLAGDTLEAKVFERANALETASLVMENLLDVSECSTNNLGSNWGACDASSVEGALGEQRRFADVASDIARSRVFTSVLVESGRLASFLRDAVAVFTRVAAEISAKVLLDNGGFSPLTGRGFSDASARWRLKRLEPLLRALCSFCLEHSPARSTFMQALLGPGRGSATPQAAAKAGHSNRGTNGEACAAAAGAIPPAIDPCKALFVLCLHPHPPTASAASALVQCLLVGGGALGAVSGPSPGAASGVGVIPAAFHRFGCGGAWGGGGIGREDPIQAALLKKMSAVALGGRKRRNREETDLRGDMGGRKEEEELGEDLATDATSVDDSSDCSGSEREVDDGWCGNRGLDEPIGLGGACFPSEGSSSPAPPPGALFPVLRRLGRIGAGLASAQAKHLLGLARGDTPVDHAKKRSAVAIGDGEWASTPPCDTGFGAVGGGLKARAVEAEQELTSILCLLSSLVLACPKVARVLARIVSLETTLAPVLAAQRSVLSGADPADYSRAPVEIVLVSLTLIAQLALALGDRSCGRVRAPLPRKICSSESNGDLRSDSGESVENGEDNKRRKVRGRVIEKDRVGKELDLARAASLRRFLGEQAAMGEIKLCVGHAACRAESKDLARRVASLISLLQVGGGADALLVADALFCFSQSAEAREAGLRSRVEAAEAAACRERAAGARRAAALEEAEELVAQMEARNAEELRRVSEEESGARRRLREAHARALTRGEISFRRAEEAAGDLEKALRAKEDALRCAGREARAKDLEIASLRGDLAGEARLRTAAEFKLEEACSQREELRRSKAEAENLVEAVKNDLREARLDIRKAWAECEAERAAARRNGAAARDTEEELKRSNARVEEAYGKLILLARSYKQLEEKSRGKMVETEELLAGAVSETKAALAQAREEERRHRMTKATLKDAEDSLQRAEERLVKVSTEASEAQAKIAAARAAAREVREEASASAREAALRRDETSRLKAELERSRAACAEKDMLLAEKSKELGQQVGIIEYINKLSSSNIANGVASSVPGPAVTVHANKAASVPPDSERGR